MIGLALEGGGALGAAHVGVLRALAQEGLMPGAVGGTSSGSIVACGLALRGRYEDVEALMDEFAAMGRRVLDLDVIGILGGLLSRIVHKNFRVMGFFKGDRLFKLIDDFTCGAAVGEAALPVVIPAVDLIGGDIMAFASQNARYKGDYRWNTSASFAQAVRSSCSIPIAFTPYRLGRAMLVDGGVLENLPVSSLMALGAHKVLGVLVEAQQENQAPPDDVLGVGLSTIRVMQRRLAHYEESAATALLRVVLPAESGLFSMDRMYEYADIGYRAAMDNIKKISRFFRLGVAGGR